MKDILSKLDAVNKQIAELKLQKDDLEKLVMAAVSAHPDEGQRTYPFGEYKVTVKTSFNYKIDKDKFLAMDLDEEINPIRVTKKYEVMPAVMRELKGKYGLLFSEFITETPAKPSITIGWKL